MSNVMFAVVREVCAIAGPGHAQQEHAAVPSVMHMRRRYALHVVRFTIERGGVIWALGLLHFGLS